jgi:hypothetical protein
VAIGIIGNACRIPAFFKGPVVSIAVKKAGGLIAGDIDVRPAVVIEIATTNSRP